MRDHAHFERPGIVAGVGFGTALPGDGVLAIRLGSLSGRFVVHDLRSCVLVFDRAPTKRPLVAAVDGMRLHGDRATALCPHVVALPARTL